MMKMLTVKPARAGILREDNSVFADEWAEVESTAYIRRRIADGDLQVQEHSAEKRSAASQGQAAAAADTARRPQPRGREDMKGSEA